MFYTEMKTFASAARHSLDAIRRLLRAANHDELREMLQDEWCFLEDHMHRVESLLEEQGFAPGTTSRAIPAIGREVLARVRRTAEGKRDATVVAGMRLIIGYVNAVAKSAADYAKWLCLDEAWLLMQRIYEQERESERRLQTCPSLGDRAGFGGTERAQLQLAVASEPALAFANS
jgi:hypothetical protein